MTALGAAAGLTATVLATPASNPPSAYARLFTVEGAAAVPRTERVYSRARGRAVDLVFTLPTRTPPPGMPITLLLHGRDGSARSAGPRGLLDSLRHHVGRGTVPPFGFVAVDGGADSYWHADRTGDDPMAMLLDEVPRWLRQRGLAGRDGTPFAVAGTSMGGFGALLYARRRRERRRPVRAIGTIAPALLTSWSDMRRRGAFRDEAEWAELDPLRNIHAVRGIPTAVWCGTSDRFIVGVRRFVERARPTLVRLSEGGHTGEFFSSAAPELVRFLGSYAPDTRPDRG